MAGHLVFDGLPKRIMDYVLDMLIDESLSLPAINIIGFGLLTLFLCKKGSPSCNNNKVEEFLAWGGWVRNTGFNGCTGLVSYELIPRLHVLTPLGSFPQTKHAQNQTMCDATTLL